MMLQCITSYRCLCITLSPF